MSGQQVIDLPNLKFEFDPAGGPDQQILLEQDWNGNVERVGLHPSQVRLIAERLGMLPPSDLEAQRTIAQLSRRMRLLAERIDWLDDLLIQAAGKGHEDLTEETTYSAATLELVREFMADLPAATASGPQPGGAASAPNAGIKLAGSGQPTADGLFPEARP